MLDKNHFDDQLRNRLRQAEMPPPSFVWENIALELARKKRRKVLAYWLAAGVVASGLVAGFWLNWSAEKVVAPAVNSAKIEQPVAVISAQNQSADLTGLAGSNEAVSENVGKNSAAILSENVESHFSKNEVSGGAKTAVFGNENRTASVKNQQPARLSKAENLASQIVENQSVESNLNEKIQTEKPVQSEFLNPSETPVLNPSATRFLLKKWADFDLLPAGQATFETPEIARPKPPVRIFKSKKRKPECPSFAEHGTAFFLDIYASPDRAVKFLTNHDTDKPGYLADRRNSEKQGFAWSAGARAGVLLGGKYTLRAGLHYSQVHETFEYFDPLDLKFLVETNPTTGLPDTLQWIYGESYKKSFNRFGLLDLPVTFGTEIGRGRFGLSLHGGAAINLLFWKRGSVISPENGEPISFTPGAKNGENVFVKNTGFSLLAGAQAFWQMNKKTRFFIEPHYRHRLKSVTLPTHPVDQKMGQGGLSFGLTRLIK